MPLTTAPLSTHSLQADADWRRGLDWLVAPMPAAEFLQHHWRAQRAVYIAASLAKIDGFYSLAAHHDAVAKVGRGHVRASYDDSSLDRVGIGLAEALEHFSRGATICVTSLSSADATLTDLCATLRGQLVTPDKIYVNSYYSPDGQGFGIHYDPQSVWILQIEGRKRWRFSRQPEVEYPNAGTTGIDFAARGGAVPADEDLACVDLAPGDVLYLPPGTWHRGEALDGPSFALSISQMHEGIVPIVTQALEARFDAVEWRRHFPTAVEGTSAIDEHLARALAQLHALTLDDLRDAWSALAIVPGGEKPSNRDHRRIRLARPLLTFDRGDAMLIYARGRRYTLPSICRELFDTLARDGELTDAQAVALLGGDAELLADLLQIGAVV